MRTSKTVKSTLLLAAFLAAAAGCGYKYTSGYASDPAALGSIRSIAVIPFENLARHYQAGVIVADLFGTELYISKRFRVMERSEVQKLCAEKGINLPESIDPEFAQSLGKTLGVDGVITGSVSEYWYRVSREAEEDAEPAVGLNARLFDASTGEVLWVCSSTRSSYDIFSAQKDPLNRVAQIVVRKMVDRLVEEMPKR